MLAQALTNNQTMKHLSLSTNHITDASATDLTAMIMANCTLASLKLDENELTDVGLDPILAVLQNIRDRREHLLTVFTVSANKISGKLLDRTEAIMKRYRKAKRFNDFTSAREELLLLHDTADRLLRVEGFVSTSMTIF